MIRDPDRSYTYNYISPEKDKEEYRSVDTLLLFVGYSRSRHTLLASLLDGHPHMVVANENNLFTRLTHGAEFNRNEMFDMLMKDSKSFLKGGKGMMMNGTLENTTHFGFWMEGYWQGAYDKYIKVSRTGRHTCPSLDCLKKGRAGHMIISMLYFDFDFLL